MVASFVEAVVEVEVVVLDVDVVVVDVVVVDVVVVVVDVVVVDVVVVVVVVLVEFVVVVVVVSRHDGGPVAHSCSHWTNAEAEDAESS